MYSAQIVDLVAAVDRSESTALPPTAVSIS